MSGTNNEQVKEEVVGDEYIEDPVPDEESAANLKDSDETDENPMPTVEQEDECIQKKYGGILPKKKPLISKDHERAFFDSADWALGKGAQKPKGPLESLRPKLQPTPHNQVRLRRSAYAPADDSEVDDGNNHASPEDENCIVDEDGGNDKKCSPGSELP